jgi:hypothetical protein
MILEVMSCWSIIKKQALRADDFSNIRCPLTPDLNSKYKWNTYFRGFSEDEACNDRTYRHETTALIISIENKYFEIAELLIRKGADVNSSTFYRCTFDNNSVKEESRTLKVLGQAIRSVSISLVRQLIKKSASLEAKDSLGRNAMDIAKEFNNHEIAEIIRKTAT